MDHKLPYRTPGASQFHIRLREAARLHGGPAGRSPWLLWSQPG